MSKISNTLAEESDSGKDEEDTEIPEASQPQDRGKGKAREEDIEVADAPSAELTQSLPSSITAQQRAAGPAPQPPPHTQVDAPAHDVRDSRGGGCESQGKKKEQPYGGQGEHSGGSGGYQKPGGGQGGSAAGRNLESDWRLR